MTELELLAPARNADIGIAAIDCGADAVYIAGPEFGARQDAGNSMEDVKRLCEYAHKFGVKIFLTLNTILYDSELTEAERLLNEAAEAGVDAIIAQDLAVFEILRSFKTALRPVGEPVEPRGPVAELVEAHASTQCAIRTPEQARFYESLGASRIVLERQLSLEQIKAIREAVGCEIEFFVHGALCVCYSGQCYMSEAVAGRSANRGACVQACRSLYDLEDSSGRTLIKDKALLSLKDYNLIRRLSDLAEAGVCSFKIEGRLKNISYVRNTVRAYSQALDKLVATHPDKYRRASFGRVEGGFAPDLSKTFNRGYTELFLDGKRGLWSSMDAPKSVGEEIGTVTSIRTLAGAAVELRPYSAAASPERSRRAKREWTRPGSSGSPAPYSEIVIKLDNPATVLRNGDGFTFSPRDGGEIRGFRGDVCEGSRIICRDVQGLYVGARLRRNLSAAFEKELESNLPTRRIAVSVDLLFSYSAATSAATGSLRFAPYPGKCSPAAALSPYSSLSREFFVLVKAKSEDGRVVEFEVDGGGQEATNRERMEAMFRSQIGKATGIYSFVLSHLDSSGSEGRLPFMSASAINGIRREIAQRLDGMECGYQPVAEIVEAPALGKCSKIDSITYKSNISNSVARKVLRQLGAKEIEDAFELTHKAGAELMRTKYCIRHELGMCLKKRPAQGPGDLYLVNNGRRYRLDFHCAKCEMTVSFAEKVNT